MVIYVISRVSKFLVPQKSSVILFYIPRLHFILHLQGSDVYTVYIYNITTR